MYSDLKFIKQTLKAQTFKQKLSFLTYSVYAW